MNRPLHITLRQYRVMPVVITVFSMALLWDMWAWFKTDMAGMPEWSNAGFSGLALAIAGIIKYALEQFSKRQERDDHD